MITESRKGEKREDLSGNAMGEIERYKMRCWIAKFSAMISGDWG